MNFEVVNKTFGEYLSGEPASVFRLDKNLRVDGGMEFLISPLGEAGEALTFSLIGNVLECVTKRKKADISYYVLAENQEICDSVFPNKNRFQFISSVDDLTGLGQEQTVVYLGEYWLHPQAQEIEKTAQSLGLQSWVVP